MDLKDPRDQRAVVIAATCRIVHRDGKWLVPSQSTERQYEVDLATEKCTCPDCEAGFLCKHVRAVKMVVRRERGADGDVTETREVTFTEKKTYRQHPKWDEAQMTEKHRFLELLFDLTRTVPDFPQPKTGRRHAPLSDMVFACTYKVYSGFSSRRFACDLKDALEKGYLSQPMHSVRVCWHLENPLLMPVFQQLIARSSLPLRAVEQTFAADSTGFSTCRFVRWFDEKYGCERSGHDWVKVHAVTGVKTNIVTAVEIAGRDANDCPFFKPLVEQTAKGFSIKEVCGDKQYLSHENLELLERLGGAAFVPFKEGCIPGEAGSAWEKMWLMYNLRREEFLARYHQRSNVESTFSMVKAKFGDSVRSRTDAAMRNECLAKFLCHNIVVVHQANLELGVEPTFRPKPEGNGKPFEHSRLVN